MKVLGVETPRLSVSAPPPWKILDPPLPGAQNDSRAHCVLQQ